MRKILAIIVMAGLLASTVGVIGCAGEDAPVAAFTATPTSGTLPVEADFTDGSTGEITDWAWDFGDGHASAVQDPSHTYSAAGAYMVSLKVIGPGGSDTETKTEYITVTAPAVVAPTIAITEITSEKKSDIPMSMALALLGAGIPAASAFGLAMACRVATFEMALKIVNPNDFDIALDSLMIEVIVPGVVYNAGAGNVTLDPLAVEMPNIQEKVYVPADTTLYLRRIFHITQLDAYVPLAMFQGMDGTSASAASEAVFRKAIAGAAADLDAAAQAAHTADYADLTAAQQEAVWEDVLPVWTLGIQAAVSSGYGDLHESYDLTWQKAFA